MYIVEDHESTTYLWAQGTSSSLSGKTVPGVPGVPTQVQLQHMKCSIPSNCCTPSGVTHFSATASIFFTLHIIRVGWILSSNNSPVDQGHLTVTNHNNNRVPGVPGMVPTSIQTPHIKWVPSIYPTTATKWSLFNLYNVRMVQLTSGTRQTHL